MQNLTCVHLSSPDPKSHASLVREINELLTSNPEPQPEETKQADDGENSEMPRDQSRLSLAQQKQRFDFAELAAQKTAFSTLNKAAKSYRQAPDGDAYENQDILCVQRLQNHAADFDLNKDIISLNQWRLFVGPPSKACWVCSKSIYTLFFRVVDKSVAQKGDLKLQMLPQRVKKNACLIGMTEELELRMESVRDLCDRVEDFFVQDFNFLTYYRKMGLITQVAYRIVDLEPDQMQKYQQLMEEHKQERYEKGWQQVLRQYVDYKNVQTVGQFPTGPVGDDKVLMVCAALVRPGKHQYYIRSEAAGY